MLFQGRLIIIPDARLNRLCPPRHASLKNPELTMRYPASNLIQWAFTQPDLHFPLYGLAWLIGLVTPQSSALLRE